MKIYRHVDWLSITVPRDCIWRGIFPGLEWYGDGSGRHGYKRRFVARNVGIEAETDAKDSAMGTHITATGSPLAEWRIIASEDDNALLSRIARNDGRLSRIDLTIDVWSASFTAETLANDLTHGRAKIKAREWRLIDGHKQGIEGFTLETGNPTSDRRFRLYDKLAEQRIKDQGAWQRLELQLRRSYAQNALNSCIEHGVEPAIIGHVQAALKWDNPEYVQIMLEDSAAPMPVARKSSKRRAWLKGQVARALAEEIAIDGEFASEFAQTVAMWLELANKRRAQTP